MTEEEYTDLIDRLVLYSDTIILYTERKGQPHIALYAGRDETFDLVAALKSALRSKKLNTQGLGEAIEAICESRGDYS